MSGVQEVIQEKTQQNQMGFLNFLLLLVE